VRSLYPRRPGADPTGSSPVGSRSGAVPRPSGAVPRPWSGVAVLVVTAGCVGSEAPGETMSTAAYVGAEQCASCHIVETDAWRGSHHDLAMQTADDQTVLGAFDDATFTIAGVTSRFFRRDGAFVVNTEGPDGTLADYEVEFVFGVEPLQQYLVAFGDGRYQALPLAWDSRPTDEGGQRWFHLRPDDTPTAGDPLHWTGRTMNWNYMCAECHSTNLLKNFDEASNTYATTWSDIDVSCEACHGPGSRHVEVAQLPEPPPDHGLADAMARRDGGWVIEPGETIAHRTTPLPDDSQIEACAHCHSRRATIAEGRTAAMLLHDTDIVSRLDEGLYYPDGQIQDEVYVYGSFVQSRMYAAGVRCSDCHDPHTLEPKADGNALCAGCHLPAAFDTPEHYNHAFGSAGAQCVACHMPATTYMVVDPRRDHSIRIPRPHLTESLGTPNACNGCHVDESTAWAVAAVQRWYGPEDAIRTRYAHTLDAGRAGKPGAAEVLTAVVVEATESPIVRATALSLLAGHPSEASLQAIQRASDDSDAMVRLGALAALDGFSPDARVPVAFRMLRDSVLAVRIEAARVLAPVPAAAFTERQRALLRDVSEEYISAQLVNADHPSAHANLGSFYAQQGFPGPAEAAYRDALAVDSTFVPAYLNLADLLRATGRDSEGDALLAEGLRVSPLDANLHHARGLLLIRSGNAELAIEELRESSRLAPEAARYSYVLAVALNSAGDGAGALDVLESAVSAHPWDPDILSFLALIARDGGDMAAALGYAERWLEVRPDDPGAAGLLTELRRSGGG
jgi:tetratricopeptide (TPR) repeat protein